MTRRPIVRLAEDTEHTDDDGSWYVGRFTGHVERGEERPGADDIVRDVPLDEALAWARPRAKRIEIRIGDEHYSAGEQQVAAMPVLPNPIPDLERRRVVGERWRDRTAADPPITWQFELTLEPPDLENRDPTFVEDALELHRPAVTEWAQSHRGTTVSDDPFRTLIADLRAALARRQPGAGEVRWASSGFPGFSVRGTVVASTGDQAHDQLRSGIMQQLVGWQVDVVGLSPIDS